MTPSLSNDEDPVRILLTLYPHVIRPGAHTSPHPRLERLETAEYWKRVLRTFDRASNDPLPGLLEVEKVEWEKEDE